MRKLALPNYDSAYHPALDAVAKGILAVDQFDDWLPDPIYWRDKDPSAVAIRALEAFHGRTLEDFPVERLRLPRKSGKFLPALILPLISRVCAHSLIGATLTRISGKLLRDKVFGFRYKDDKLPPFSMPGEELEQAVEQADQVFDLTDQVYLVDVADFTTAAQFDRLQQILLDIGALEPELIGVANLAEMPDMGMPAMDNAFLALYNYYLRPTDQMLEKKKLNFVRFLEEYFVFSQDAVEAIRVSLRTVGLSGVVKASFDRRSNSQRADETVFSFDGFGSMSSAYFHCTQQASMCTELHLHVNSQKASSTDTALDLLFKGPLDGVDVVPALRLVHMARKASVLDVAPYDSASAEYRAYRRSVQKYRTALHGIIEDSIGSGVGWPVTWAAPLLSDVGELQKDSADLLMRTVGDASIETPARLVSIASLARAGEQGSVTEAIKMVLKRPEELTGEHSQRAILLAAHYCALRGDREPWNEVVDAVGQSHPSFLRLAYASQGGRKR